MFCFLLSSFGETKLFGIFFLSLFLMGNDFFVRFLLRLFNGDKMGLILDLGFFIACIFVFSIGFF